MLEWSDHRKKQSLNTVDGQQLLPAVRYPDLIEKGNHRPLASLCQLLGEGSEIEISWCHEVLRTYEMRDHQDVTWSGGFWP
jgi:hypothetical protein